MSATEADRDRARQVADALSELLDDMSGMYPAGVDLIAEALAAEREKARDDVYRELAALAGQDWRIAPEQQP